MPKKSTPEPKIDIQTNLNSLKAKLQQKASQLQKGEEVKETEDDLFWFGPPVSPREFIESPEYFDNQGKGGVVYPWVIQTLEDIFSGQYHCPKYTTAVILAGKGSGKSWCAGMFNAYMWYWILCFKNFTKFLKAKDGILLDPNMTTCIIGLAKSAKQVKEIVFDNTAKLIHQVKALRDRDWLPDPKIKSELQYSAFNQESQTYFKKLLIIPGNSSETFAIGFGVFGVVIDEACFWQELESDPVRTVYTELDERRFSRFKNNGLITMISSANVDGDFASSFEKKAQDDPLVYFKRLSLYDCKPEYFNKPRFTLKVKRERVDGTIEDLILTPPEELKPRYDADREGTLRAVDSIPTLAGNPFYPDFALLMTKINTGRTDPCPDLGLKVPEGPQDVYTRLPASFHGNPGTSYRVHVDLSKGAVVNGQCGLGFALAHKIADPVHGFKIKLDLAVRFKAPSNKEIQVNDILQLILDLKIHRGFDINMVTFDQWNSLQPIQTINAWEDHKICKNIKAEELAVGYKQHAFLKTCINAGQLDFYQDNNLLFELKRLEDFGNEHLDHGPNSMKDEADAVAGAVYSAAALEPADDDRVKPRLTHGMVVGKGALVGKSVNYRTPPNGNIPMYRRNI